MTKKSKTHSLYLHFPFCLHLCNYCDFYKHLLRPENSKEKISEFESKLNLQILQMKDYHQQNNADLAELESFYMGGGTPSLWGKQGIQYLQDLISSEFVLKPDVEWTLEVDPNTVSLEVLDLYFELGVNRISVGVQSYDDDYLKLLDRIHQKKDIEYLLNHLKTKKINFSVDLLIGIPLLEKARNIEDEINSLIQFNPSHFSVYILSNRQNYPHLKKMPNDELVAEEYLKVCSILSKAGFHQYEVSNFSLPGFESKHNWNYWLSNNVAAIGPVATGYINLEKMTEKKGAIRYQFQATQNNLKETERLTEEQLKMEEIYLLLRTKRGINLSLLIHKSNQIPEALATLVNLWDEQGLIRYSAQNVISFQHNLILNSKGMIILDTLFIGLWSELEQLNFT